VEARNIDPERSKHGQVGGRGGFRLRRSVPSC
jgi:hypothetical protein